MGSGEGALGGKNELSRDVLSWKRRRRMHFGRTARRGDGSQSPARETAREMRFAKGR